jgi:hypothetical protein
MITSCGKCGGLRTTEHLESFAGMPCKCITPTESTVPTVSKPHEFWESEYCGDVCRVCPFKPDDKIHQPATSSSEVVTTSSDAWRKWFERMGERATSDVVNATATLVIEEREIITALSSKRKRK